MKSTTFALTALAGYAAAAVAPSYHNSSSSAAPAPGPDAYVTQVVTALTTYCPSPTTLTYNSKTYTVTKPTTLTITDCPCTHTYPAAYPTHQAPPPPYKPSGGVPPNMTHGVPPVTTTKMVSEYTTVCPSPTTFTMHDSTYTVSSATTLTITHCPGGCPVPTTYVPPVSLPKPIPSSAPPVSLPQPIPSPSSVPPVSLPMPIPSSAPPVSLPKPIPSSAPPASPPKPTGATPNPPVTQIPDGQVQVPGPSVSRPVASAPPAQYTGAAAEKVLSGGSLFAAVAAAALMI